MRCRFQTNIRGQSYQTGEVCQCPAIASLKRVTGDVRDLPSKRPGGNRRYGKWVSLIPFKLCPIHPRQPLFKPPAQVIVKLPNVIGASQQICS